MMEYKLFLENLVNNQDLGRREMDEVMNCIMAGKFSQSQIGAFLAALRMKGESLDEITAAAHVLRKFSTRITCRASGLVDTCGTGGDGANTFNISTAAAFIAAGAGVVIAKHGNRSVSSQCGSADVLMELGVNIDVTPEKTADCIDSVGIGFLFAQKYHPAMKHVAGIRKELGVRTIFNMLGPLANPANAAHQVLGVYSPDLTELFAEVLKELGSESALVVHGADHIDEISVTGKTRMSELKNGQIKTYDFDPLPYIDHYYQLTDIRGGKAGDNAKIIRNVFSGKLGAHADIAMLNGAAAIYISGNASDFDDAVEKAKASLASGSAFKKLEALIQFTGGLL